MNLLVVDDEQQIRDGLVNTIQWQKYSIKKIFKASNGYEAIDIIKRNKVDLMITDVRMTGMNGIDLIRKAKMLIPELKSIVISGYAEFEYVKDALRLQVSDYLLKPININELVQLVCRLLDVDPESCNNGGVIKIGSVNNADIKKKPYNLLVKKCLAYIEDNYMNNISLQDLSELLERNSSYISHMFNKEMGKGLTEYINEIRIYKAIQLIKSSNLLLYEISEMVGFDDYRYFINIFKKFTGKSPTEFSRTLES